jgi:hypothetical protein
MKALFSFNKNAKNDATFQPIRSMVRLDSKLETKVQIKKIVTCVADTKSERHEFACK